MDVLESVPTVRLELAGLFGAQRVGAYSGSSAHTIVWQIARMIQMKGDDVDAVNDYIYILSADVDLDELCDQLETEYGAARRHREDRQVEDFSSSAVDDRAAALAPDSWLKHSGNRGGEDKDKPTEPGSGQDDAEQVPSAPRTLGEARDHLMTRQGFVAALGLGGASWASNKELKPLLGEPTTKVGNTSWYTVGRLIETVEAAAPKGFWEGRAKPLTLPIDSAIRKKLRPPLEASKRSSQE